MNKILVTVVLGMAATAAAHAAQPAQPQPQPTPAVPAQTAASAPQGPVIKDPAEYNAYMGAIQQKDAAAQISGLEAFMTQYPNSQMKLAVLQTLMQDYQQANNTAKTVETAQKLVAADPTNVRAMALLAYIDRQKAQGGDPNAQQILLDAKKYGQMGLDAMPKFAKPDGTSDADFAKMKSEMTAIFDAAVGIADLTSKDYAGARTDLRVAADATPTDFSVVYPLALAYAGPTPADPNVAADPIDTIWYAARASVVAPTPQYQQQIEKYAKSQYVKYHGGDDGWSDVLAQAKASPTQPAGFTIKPAPGPDEQAHNMVTATAPEKMDFATWEFVLSNGKQPDQDTVWNAIKGKPVQMNGTVITAAPEEIDIAGSSDDIDAKKADIKLMFEEKLPAKLIPKEGASFDFQGEPSAYTSTPFMMTMTNGKVLKAATPAPVKKAPVHHKAAAQ
jgi:hypothetical protein